MGEARWFLKAVTCFSQVLKSNVCLGCENAEKKRTLACALTGPTMCSVMINYSLLKSGLVP
jgi:hypothetical protein